MIFNAIIIPLLIPIALKGVTYRPVGAGALLRRNLLIYGLGGVIAPFIGIKLIDVLDRPAPGPGRHRCERPASSDPTHLERKDIAMIRETVNALAACVVTFVLCAVAYPAAVWGLGQLAFPRQAEGSLIYGRDRTVIGSELIAQPFASDRYFHPRPSAVDYKADAAGGSNLGPKNPDLRKKVAERAEALRATPESPAPVDLVTASGGGLDPHISPEAARYQARPRGRRARPAARPVRALIDAHTERSGGDSSGRRRGQRAPAEPRPGRATPPPDEPGGPPWPSTRPAPAPSSSST